MGLISKSERGLVLHCLESLYSHLNNCVKYDCQSEWGQNPHFPSALHPLVTAGSRCTRGKAVGQLAQGVSTVETKTFLWTGEWPYDSSTVSAGIWFVAGFVTCIISLMHCIHFFNAFGSWNLISIVFVFVNEYARRRGWGERERETSRVIDRHCILKTLVINALLWTQI